MYLGATLQPIISTVMCVVCYVDNQSVHISVQPFIQSSTQRMSCCRRLLLTHFSTCVAGLRWVYTALDLLRYVPHTPQLSDVFLVLTVHVLVVYLIFYCQFCPLLTELLTCSLTFNSTLILSNIVLSVQYTCHFLAVQVCWLIILYLCGACILII